MDMPHLVCLTRLRKLELRELDTDCIFIPPSRTVIVGQLDHLQHLRHLNDLQIELVHNPKMCVRHLNDLQIELVNNPDVRATPE